MSHPQGPPPYRYGPDPRSGPESPSGASPSGPDAPGSPGSGEGPYTPGSPGSGEGPYAYGPHPAGATWAHQPGTPQPGGEQPGGQPPHPQVPQQAGSQTTYGYPPGWQPYGTPEGPTNSFAVASLVLGILTPVGCIPGVLSIIFGIVGLVQIQERREKGRGLAIGGLAATGAWLVLGLALTIISIMLDDESGGDEPGTGGDRTPVHQVEVGHCVEALPGDGEEEVVDIATVDCDAPHVAEVYAVFDLADRDWPGEDLVMAEAEDGCYERLQQDFPDAWVDPDVGIYYLIPGEEGWAEGDHEVVCIAQYLDGTRTGSLFD